MLAATAGFGVWRYVYDSGATEPGPVAPPEPEPGPSRQEENEKPVVLAVPSIELADAERFRAPFVTREPRFELAGTVRNPPGGKLAATHDGDPSEIDIASDGTFARGFELRRNATNDIRLTLGNAAPVAIRVDHDDVPPAITIAAPKLGARRTKERTIDVRVDVVDRHETSVRVGAIAAKKVGDQWAVDDIQLSSEGPNTLRIEATDAAGVQQAEELVVTRDTTAPSILKCSERDKSHEPGSTIQVRLEFDETVEVYTVASKRRLLRADTVTIPVVVPEKPGPFEFEIELEDDLGNKELRTVEFTAGAPRELPVIELTTAPPEDRPTKETQQRIRGRVANRTGDRLDVELNGKRSTQPLDANGAFDFTVELRRDADNILRLAHSDGREVTLQVRQDATDPVLTLVEPVKSPWETRDPRIDVVVEVRESDLESVRFDAQPMESLGRDRYRASGVALTEDGTRRFTVVATDRAGRSATTTIEVVRDTAEPILLDCNPPAGTLVVPESELTLELRFNERVELLRIDGKTQTPYAEVVKVTVRVPKGEGPFEVRLHFEDRLRNGDDALLSFERPIVEPKTPEPEPEPTPSPVKPVRLPAGWEAVGSEVGFGGWPLVARHPATGLTFRLVPPGTFRMGFDAKAESKERRDADEVPVHDVRVAEPFYMATTETSVGSWRKFAQAASYTSEAERTHGAHVWNPESLGWDVNPAATWSNPMPGRGFTPTDEHPVTQVTWNDAQAFCQHFGFELPTEVQWEYACRAGTRTRYWWGNDPRLGAGKANFCDTSLKALASKLDAAPFDDRHPFTAPVDSFAASPFGLHNMLGNVWEWCSDSYDAKVYTRRARDPKALPAVSSTRVLRGGAWCYGEASCRACERNSLPISGSAYDTIGFRPIWNAR